MEYVDSADIKISENNWKDAEQLILKALRLEPGNFNNSLLLSNLGYVQTQLEKYDEAIKNYSVGLSMTPNSTVLLTNRARTFLIINRNNESFADSDKALKIDSTLIEARRIRALSKIALKDYNGAEVDLKYILRKDSTDTDIFSSLADCQMMLGKYHEAIKNYDKALALEKDERNYFNKTLLLAESKELEKASESIKEAINLFPSSGNLYLLRAYIYKLYYRISDSERDKKKAYELNADPELEKLLFGTK